MNKDLRLLNDSYRIYNLEHLNINVQEKPLIDSFSQNFVAFGSCFAGNVSELLSHHGMKTYWNVSNSQHFSPRGLCEKLEALFESGDEFGEKDCFENKRRGLIISKRHMDVAIPSDQPLSELIEKSKELDWELREAIENADTFIITLGSPTYITDNQTGKVVCAANGLDRDFYTIRRAKVNELIDDIQKIFMLLSKNCRNNFSAVITVSPQRYAWLPMANRFDSREQICNQSMEGKDVDGYVYNNGDKARLRVAVDEFIEGNDQVDISYFPSFDIVLDELRSIETFSNDLNDSLHVAHPTAHYVCNRFLNAYCSEAMKDCLNFHSFTRLALKKDGALGASKTAFLKAEEILEKIKGYREKLSDEVLAERMEKQIQALIRAQYLNAGNLKLLALADSLSKKQNTVNIPPDINEDEWKAFLLRIDCAVDTGKKIAFHGRGIFAKMIIEQSTLKAGDVRLCTDNNISESHICYFGYQVYPTHRLCSEDIDCVVIGSYNHSEEIFHQLKQLLPASIEIIAYGIDA